ncbi:MAG: ATP-binding cassette domain-containing protein [Candidatus Obscuribacterales bacterium]|nr:ATP-binding cassette domain-containing protein [Candidatus Obscuribacterales bacterium]
MTAAIELNQLSKSFVVKSGRPFKRVSKEVLAVDSISLSIEKGQSVAFVGPNGAGKSTTIKMLTGILTPSSGEARVLGYVPWKERTRLTRKIGAVFGQRSQLWYHLPPRDTFELLSRIYNLDRARFEERRDQLIEIFQMSSYLDLAVRKLSLGQRMRAEVACSLLHFPQVLFLDEPTIGLDVIARQELRELIRKWNREEGITVFLTSHDAGDIESVAKRVIIINHGRVVLDDKVSKVKRSYLNAKVMSVKFREEPKVVELAGVEVLKTSYHSLKLSIDTEIVTIEKVMSEILKAGSVADITIENPPLESIIAHIYNQPAVADDLSEATLREDE